MYGYGCGYGCEYGCGYVGVCMGMGMGTGMSLANHGQISTSACVMHIVKG